MPVIAPPTPDAPLRFWVGGDSITQTFGTSMQQVAASTGVMTPSLDYHVSTGLARPDYYNWPEHLLKERTLATRAPALETQIRGAFRLDCGEQPAHGPQLPRAVGAAHQRAALALRAQVGVEPEGMGVSPDSKFTVATSESTSMAHVIDNASQKVVANVLVNSARAEYQAARQALADLDAALVLPRRDPCGTLSGLVMGTPPFITA